MERLLSMDLNLIFMQVLMSSRLARSEAHTVIDVAS